jgi:hypothetical protein
VNTTPISAVLDAGFWTITPDAQPTSGDYSILLDEQGFTNATSGGASYYTIIKRANCASALVAPGTHTNATQSASASLVHAQRSQLTSFSDFFIGFGGGILPIHLIYLNGFHQQQSNQLEWSTIDDQMVKSFVIERSADQFEFYSIGTVVNNTHSTDSHTFHFEDKSLTGGLYYYRLKMVDDAGQISFSPVIAIRNEELVGGIQCNLFPNPTADFLHVEIASTTPIENAKIVIVDLLGRSMMYEKFVIVKGTNQYEIDTRQLALGMYELKLIDQNEKVILTKKLTIVK